ncbi:hypothetical protein FANTH_4023 [Fusarium anthophilum]|uniref:Uncharacterized protein n=1 Tax=Fusarium anthophilum TaxID=48485 RepID=A0A8H4ZR07_9HYPO|nr:hypothetical protein FANTH_4023 [Fusarium anthophilum]
MDTIEEFLLESPAGDDVSPPTRGLDALIDKAKEEIRATDLRAQDPPPVITTLPYKWITLALLLRKRYDKGMKKEDLDESIESMEKAIGLAIIDYNPRLSEKVCVWSLKQVLEYWEKRNPLREQVKSTEEIEIRVCKVVAWADSCTSAEIGGLLAHELMELISRLTNRDNGDKRDPSAAIEHLRKAVAVACFRKSGAGLNEKLSDELMARYDLKKDANDLDEAINWTREALEMLGPASQGHSAGTKKLLIDLWRKLSDRLMARYDLKKDANDLDEAINWTKEALEMLGPASQGRSAGTKKLLIDLWRKLSDRLMARYDVKKDANDLNEAIKWTREAFEALHSHNPDPSFEAGEMQAAMSEKLGHYLMARYDVKKDANDLDEAINWTREALEMLGPASQGHSARTKKLLIDRCSKLGDRLRARYDLKKDANDLNEAIGMTSRIIATKDLSATIGQFNTYCQFWAISARLGERFRLEKNSEDLNEAIRFLEKTVAEMSRDCPDPSSRIGKLQIAMSEKLSYYLMLRYELIKDPKDVNEAIRLRKAIMDVPDVVAPGQSDKTRKADQMVRLTNSLITRYDLKKDSNDLDEAIKLINAFFEVLDSTSQGQSAEATKVCKFMWVRLSNCLQERYEVNQRTEDLDKAIKAEEQLLVLAVCDGIDGPAESSILNSLLQKRDELRNREASNSKTG